MTDEKATKIRVLIVDDSRLTRISVRTTLKLASNIELVGEAEDGSQAINQVAKLSPDVILMDIGMPIMDGVKATQAVKLRFPEVKVVMLTSHDEEDAVLDAFASGANSYCLKEIPPEMLIQVIESTAHGACWIDPKIARVVMTRLKPTEEHVHKTAEIHPFPLLTEREVDVLRLVTQGLNNSEISEKLCISMNTVKTHLKNIFQKLEVEDRTSAALRALRERIV